MLASPQLGLQPTDESAADAAAARGLCACLQQAAEQLGQDSSQRPQAMASFVGDAEVQQAWARLSVHLEGSPAVLAARGLITPGLSGLQPGEADHSGVLRQLSLSAPTYFNHVPAPPPAGCRSDERVGTDREGRHGYT